MLWISKHRPKNLQEIGSHDEICEMLKCYTLETIPNLIIHGQEGHGKKSITYALMNHLYGSYPNMKQRSIDMSIIPQT